jgi:PIN domain nuclease of toxin-antitoxin system
LTGPYLLDTSTILWALAAPERLSPAAREIFEAGNVLRLSVASYWEVILKVRKGQLAISDPVAWWQAASQGLGAEVLSIRANHVSALQALPEHHRDPFDRILIAQAITDGLTLLTSDEMIHRYPVPVHW